MEKDKPLMNNERFSILAGSAEFLNMILRSISSCILLLDKEMRLMAFNDSLKTFFSNHKDEDILYMRCGEALGCAWQIEEMTECGNTSHCAFCDLRVAALKSYIDGECIYKEHIIKPFFTHTRQKVDKHLQFSTRLFRFRKDKYIFMMVDDISRFFRNR